MDTDIFRQLLAGITAKVTLQNTDWSVTWDARIDRLKESVAPGTREIQVMAVVDRPYAEAIPGKRPPLMPGMFCHVALTAPPRPGQVVLPRTAVHDSAVYLVGPDNRLVKKPVTVGFAQSEFVIIESGLSGEERGVVSDPAFAIVGMKVQPVMDDALLERLKHLARAQGITP
jgi:multidrug efflux pump subunit AcrA (membrane-fusion protein)